MKCRNLWKKFLRFFKKPDSIHFAGIQFPVINIKAKLPRLVSGISEYPSKEVIDAITNSKESQKKFLIFFTDGFDGANKPYPIRTSGNLIANENEYIFAFDLDAAIKYCHYKFSGRKYGVEFENMYAFNSDLVAQQYPEIKEEDKDE